MWTFVEKGSDYLEHLEDSRKMTEEHVSHDDHSRAAQMGQYAIDIKNWQWAYMRGETPPPLPFDSTSCKIMADTFMDYQLARSSDAPALRSFTFSQIKNVWMHLKRCLQTLNEGIDPEWQVRKSLLKYSPLQ